MNLCYPPGDLSAYTADDAIQAIDRLIAGEEPLWDPKEI